MLKRLTYRPEFLALARRLGLSKSLRKCYYYWARPRNGILRLQLGGREAQFFVRTPEELRILESAGGGEQAILERLMFSLVPGDVVYDVGANVGLYTILLALVVGEQGRVVAFEPEPRHFHHLRDNIRLNQLTNIRCFNMALGKQKGRATLHPGRVIGGSSLVPGVGDTGSGTIVEVVTGDEWASAENLPPPRLVKIDVECYEYEVLQGLCSTLAQPACEYVCCEVHPSLLPGETRPEDVLDLLTSLGFADRTTHSRRDSFHVLARKHKVEGRGAWAT